MFDLRRSLLVYENEWLGMKTIISILKSGGSPYSATKSQQVEIGTRDDVAVGSEVPRESLDDA